MNNSILCRHGVLAIWLVFAAALPAQTEQTAGVPVRLSGGGTVANYGGEPGTLELSIAGLETSPGAGNGYRLMTGQKVFQAPVGSAANNFAVYDSVVTTQKYTTVQLEPGKLYNLSADGEAISAYDFRLVAPPGYQVEIDGVIKNFYRKDPAGTTFVNLLPVRVLPVGDDFAGRAGTASSLTNGRLFWQVALGSLRNGSSAGNLTLVDSATSSSWSSLFTPAGLHYDPLSTEVSVYRVSNLIRQIVANEAVVDIDYTAGNSYFTIKFFSPSQVTNSVFPRTFSGEPFVKYKIEQVDAATTPTKLKITSDTRKLADGTAARTAWTTLQRSGTWPNFEWTMQEWTDGTGLSESYRLSSGGSGTRTEAEQVRVPGAGGTVATRNSRTYTVKPWGEVLTTETRGTTDPVTTEYTYYENSGQPGSYGFLSSVKTTGNHWEAYEYYDASANSERTGAIKYRFRPAGNDYTVPTYNPAQGEVTYFEYEPDAFGHWTRVTKAVNSINGSEVGRSTTLYTNAVVTLATGYAFNVVTANRNDYSSANDPLPTTTKYFREDTADGFYRGQTHSVTRSDGAKVAYAYQRGTWNGSGFALSGNGGLDQPPAFDPQNPTVLPASRVSVITGTTGGSYSAHDGYDIDDLNLISNKSTMEVTIRDSRALVVRTESYVRNGSVWSPVASVNYSYDAAGFLTSRLASNGATYSATYKGELKENETDESGIKVSYTYDPAGRVATVTKEGGPTTTFAYDAEDRSLSETTGSGETIYNARTYDDAGRIDTETPAGLGMIDYSYAPGARQRTVTLPADGATRTETYLIDGRLEKVEGSAVVPEYYSYSLDGAQHRVQVFSGTSGSPRWQRSWIDWLGRPVKSERPGFSKTTPAQDNFVELHSYEAVTGRLFKTSRTGYAPTRYAYDELGQLNRTGLDIGDDGLAENSTDRINDSNQQFENYESAWWLREETKTYPFGNGAAITTSVTRKRLTGHPANRLDETRVTDVEGNTVVRTVDVNRSTKTLTVTTVRPGYGTNQVETIVNGQATKTVTHDGRTLTLTYDSLSRPSVSYDSRNNPTTTIYKYGTTLVQTVKDALDNETNQFYDTRGRRTRVTDAAGKHTRYAYNPRGQLTYQWGDAAYPVSYDYDAVYGDRTGLSTYRSAPATDSPSWPTVGTADTTTFAYDPASGLLWKKTDAATKFVEFAYNVRGQTSLRYAARTLPGSTTKVTSTYSYDGNTGELKDVTYNDGTPAVAYEYTRLGLLNTVVDGTSANVTDKRVYTYDTSKPWRLASTALPAFYGGRVVTSLYASLGDLGRPVGFQLGSAAGDYSDLEQRHGYDNFGRLAIVLSKRSNNTVNRVFRYQYKQGTYGGEYRETGLIAGVTIDGHPFTSVRDYENSRDLLAWIDSQWSQTSITRFDYTYNTLYQRVTAKQSGDSTVGAFADYGDATYRRYTYNPRGELTAAPAYLGSDVSETTNPLPGRQDAYDFDSIGNRKSTNRTGISNLKESYMGDVNHTQEGANALNQYEWKENDAAPVQGTVDAATTKVAVSRTTEAPARQGRYWATEVLLANATTPRSTALKVYAGKLGGGASGSDLLRVDSSRIAQLAAALQQFKYDADGNMTTDGVWDFAYDAENRLYRMATTSLAIGAGIANRILEFRYDYLGRRVQKRVLDGTTSGELLSRRYLYTGWNLVAEFDAPGGSSVGALVRSYTWGLDVAGSLGATGGVGAMLQIHDYSAGKTLLPTYDGNGNVAALLNADTGVTEAAYEYDPSGQLLRLEGSYATSNPFRFSTKFHDGETGLVYYGHRYYAPGLGRFVNRDPIEETGGLNLYGFCGNDGVNGYDYLGYSWFSKLWKKARHSVIATVLNFIPVVGPFLSRTYTVAVAARYGGSSGAALALIGGGNYGENGQYSVYVRTAVSIAQRSTTGRSPGLRTSHSRSLSILSYTAPVGSDDPIDWAIWESDVISGRIEPDFDDLAADPIYVGGLVRQRTARRQVQAVREIVATAADVAKNHPMAGVVISAGEGIAGEDLHGNRIEGIDRASRFGGPLLSRIRGWVGFGIRAGLKRLTKPGPVQNHHKVPYENSIFRHHEHPLAKQAKADLRRDAKNQMDLGGHQGRHSPEYHREVQRRMNEGYERVKGKGVKAAQDALEDIYEEIEMDIASGKLKPYESKDVWIP